MKIELIPAFICESLLFAVGTNFVQRVLHDLRQHPAESQKLRQRAPFRDSVSRLRLQICHMADTCD